MWQTRAAKPSVQEGTRGRWNYKKKTVTTQPLTRGVTLRHFAGNDGPRVSCRRASLLFIPTRVRQGVDRKMAARWGAGEETLTACNMEFFPIDTLDESAELSPKESLEVLQSCLDPSILSIFEDTPTIETKGLDEESEATLLTALTEILDNVDDENLSPFDTLPDSDLLSGQKGREHSPLRRLLCLSRSPPEKEKLCNARALSTGKSLPRMQTDTLQRSDGEEEEDGSLTLSPLRQDSCPDNGLLDWEGLTLPHPITFEQEGEDGVSVSLGDLVRHMHPYCMTICVENEEGEQLLPEGGILLEVVDQGENGEPILAIPNMDLPVSVPLKELSSEDEQKASDEAEEAASESSEHIIVDDDEDPVSEASVKTAAPVTKGLCSDVKDKMIIKRQKEEIREKSPSRRKKKKKCKKQCQPNPAEERVLRSSTARKTQEAPKKPEKLSVKAEKKSKVPKVPVESTPAPSPDKPTEENSCQSETQAEASTTTLLTENNVQVVTRLSPRQDTAPLTSSPEKTQSSCLPTAVSSQQPDKTPKPLAELEDSSVAPAVILSPVSSESPAVTPSSVTAPITPPVSETLPPVAPTAPEPKPKSLSLAEYRRLRQQKKPAPVEKLDSNSTKWPSLPELPKELLPIPCLPDPNPKDPRRPSPQTAKKEVEEVKPAWQPRGPCAPPTPEALLVPPAYMVASSSKVSAAAAVPRPQQTPEPSTLSPPQKPSVPLLSSVNSTTQNHNAAQLTVPYAPQSAGSSACLQPATRLTSSIDGKCPPALSGGQARVSEIPKSLPESSKFVESTKTCHEITTVAATCSAPSAPQKTTVASQKVPVVAAPTSFNNPVPSDSKSSKPTTNGTQLSDSPSLTKEPDVLETKKTPTTTVTPQKAKSPTQELIEAFTSEIGIEAADLTSLLEQFEETQAKEEQCVPEVSGRAAAVGNSSVELVPEKTVVERVRANDLSSTAALTPPATPPHHMWKPLAPVALLGKSKTAEASKLSPSKVIQIEARPLPSVRSRSKPTPAAATVAPDLACMDHDYCLPNKGTLPGEQGKRWNVKQQSFITIKPIKQHAATTTQTPTAVPASSLQSTTNPTVSTKAPDFPLAEPLETNDEMEGSSVLETPDASPAQQETESTFKDRSPRRGPHERSYRRHASCRSPSPRYSPKERTGGRSRKRRSRHSPSPMSSCSGSDSCSSRSRSRSCSPAKKRYRHRNSESSSSSSSRSSSRFSRSVSRSPPRRRRYSYSSSRSGSWSRSRSRSRSPQRRAQWGRRRQFHSPSYRPSCGNEPKANTEEVKRRKEKAIEERRVVYVGRIRGTMTQKELGERFSLFGDIEECTLHFRDHGDNYGFVTYYDTKDAFTAIENGSKLRKPDELPFDLCFGGRRQFCQTSYADLDSSREYDPLPAKGKYHALDFDTLLKQAQQNLKR
ncbi:peroxisome proliferator-activated receptor gamma coactivator-related protein 1 [Acanthochromis polyacanthus]|uniref:peroxisome proliferator-activated receptor gamma coactivator-related protein 1 n=1 Tax=Acanthochromis polyacanthus TaxID=80966 RepID=UPI002233E706|nr:peroxisome proliferator-activated receptor gamma coactivator-related protein 1 [Acanthochromis polyacanthus]